MFFAEKACNLHINKTSNKDFKINNNLYSIDSTIQDFSTANKREIIVNKALSMINTPYLWGGRTAWGIDCSGFAQLL